MISKSIAVSFIAFIITVSTDNDILKYIFSESFSSQYSTYFHSNNPKLNQTSLDAGCDFLNLCGKHVDNKLSEISLPFNNKIVDISYLNFYLELPFP
jgi:hypothetical protein